MFKSILIATDFSNTSIEAMQFGLLLAEKTNADVEILYVHKLETPTSLKELEKQEKQLRSFYAEKINSFIETVKDKFNLGRGINITPVVTFGSALDNIILHSEGKDLVIVGSHGKRSEGITERFLGSIPTNLINNLPAPLIIFPRNKPYNIEVKNFLYITKKEEEKILETKATFLREFVNLFTNKIFMHFLIIKYRGQKKFVEQLAKKITSDFSIAIIQKQDEERIIKKVEKENISFLIVNLSKKESISNKLTPNFSDNFYNCIGIPVLLIKNSFFNA